jgi:glycosyl transferase family 87
LTATQSPARAVTSTTRASTRSRLVSARDGLRGFSARSLLGVALGIAFATRLAAIVAFGDVSSGANIWEYGEEAQCALRHAGDLCMYYSDASGASYPSAYMPPLLSYSWLGLFGVFGDGSIARGVWLAANLAAALGCVALIYRLTLEMWPSRWAAFAAAVLFAVYPTFVFVTATYHQTNWAVLLLLATIAMAVKLSGLTADGDKSAARWHVRPWMYGAFGGVLCGLAALNRTEMLVVGPAVLALGAAWSRNWKIVVVTGVSAMIAFAVVLTPWTARNYEHFGEAIPTAQSSGYNLWKGFNPYTNGSGNLSEDPEGPGWRMRESIRATVAPGAGYETRVQAAYSHAFEDDLRASSVGRLVELTATKVALLWGFDWTDSDVTGGIDYRLPWLLSNILAIAGLVTAVRRRRCVGAAPAAIYALALGLLTAAYAVTAVHARYRMHIEPIIFIMAGIGADALWARVRCAAFPSPSVTGHVHRSAITAKLQKIAQRWVTADDNVTHSAAVHRQSRWYSRPESIASSLLHIDKAKNIEKCASEDADAGVYRDV